MLVDRDNVFAGAGQEISFVVFEDSVTPRSGVAAITLPTNTQLVQVTGDVGIKRLTGGGGVLQEE